MSFVVGMCNIDMFVCNCCETKISVIDLAVSMLKTVYTCLNIAKLVMISANYHDIAQSLLLKLLLVVLTKKVS